MEVKIAEVEVVAKTSAKKNIKKYRKWFRAAIDASNDWRAEAREDYDFVSGNQWTENEKQAFISSGRPAITINRIKPLINVLSGYQRLNRYDIDFLPRTQDDGELCKVRKGLTKYILDSCDYNREESAVFLDAAIGGIGWFDVSYRFEEELNDGEAVIKRVDPFGVYVDPEARAQDYSDAKYICRAKWVDKEELIAIYPEHKDEIELQYEVFDKAEEEENTHYASNIEPTWYQRDLQKVRLVEVWFKERGRETQYVLADGTIIPQKDITVEHFLSGLVVGNHDISVTRVKVAVFMGQVLLEEQDSPYEHGEFPLVPLVCYRYGLDDIPAGFVRDLKDPQREINKRRIQMLHILNTTGNGGGWIEEGAMTPEQEAEFKHKGNIPGHYQKVKPSALTGGKIRERSIAPVPAGVVQAEQQSTADLTAISGINESLMGVDIPNGSSGRAIELKQKQAITHIAPMFDSLRSAKKRIAMLLWGRRGHKGIIPQFYTEDKVYRIEGVNGQQFIRVNQQIAQQDPMGNVIHQTLNDLSHGDFDIVIADVTASATQRQAQMWELLEAVQKLGLPGDLVFDIILDLSDLPSKEEIKKRWAERQQQQGQAQQAQLQAQKELEMIKNINQNQSIAFKDAPLPIQLAMAARQGLIDPQIAQYAIDNAVAQMYPLLAQQMAQQRQAQQQMPQQAPAQPTITIAQPQGQQPPQAEMTQPAINSLMAGNAPSVL